MKKSLVTGLIALGLAAMLVGCGSSNKTVIDEIEYSYYGLETDSFTNYLDEKDLLYKSDFDIYNMVADDFLGHRAYYILNPYYMDIYITADDDNELTNASKDVKKYLEKNQDKKFDKSELGEYMDYNGEVAWVYLFYRNQDGYSSYRDFYDENNGLGKVYVTEYKDIKSKKNKEFNFKAIAYNVDTNLLDIQNEYPNILGNINAYIKLRVIGYKDMHMYPLFSEYDSSIKPPVYDENALYGGVDSAASDDADGGALENDEVAISAVDTYSRLYSILKNPNKITNEVINAIGLEDDNTQFEPGYYRYYQVEDDTDEYLPPTVGRAAAEIPYETLIPQDGTIETIVNIAEFIRLTEDSKKRFLKELFEIANVAAQYGECQSVDNDSKGEFVGISNADVKKLYDNLLCYEEIKKILEESNDNGDNTLPSDTKDGGGIISDDNNYEETGDIGLVIYDIEKVDKEVGAELISNGEQEPSISYVKLPTEEGILIYKTIFSAPAYEGYLLYYLNGKTSYVQVSWDSTQTSYVEKDELFIGSESYSMGTYNTHEYGIVNGEIKEIRETDRSIESYNGTDLHSKWMYDNTLDDAILR